MSSWEFPEGTLIEPGTYLMVYWGMANQGQEGAVYTGRDNINTMHNAGGDLALFNAGNGLEHYVQWAQAGNLHEEDAVNAGLWNMGEFTAQPMQGQLLQFVGPEISAAGWNIVPSNDGCRKYNLGGRQGRSIAR